MKTITEILTLGPVMPVVVIDDAHKAVPLAQALLAGGIRTMEITLRTTCALDAIEAVASGCGDIVVGAGTVITAKDARAASGAGATFAVSPGTLPQLVEACRADGTPLLGGAATLSEIMTLRNAGMEAVKFFPASAAGGTAFVRALAGPLPDMIVCPTGGITLKSAPEWLGLANVPCVGGSWVAPRDTIERGDFAAITANAREAAALGAG